MGSLQAVSGSGDGRKVPEALLISIGAKEGAEHWGGSPESMVAKVQSSNATCGIPSPEDLLGPVAEAKPSHEEGTKKLKNVLFAGGVRGSNVPKIRMLGGLLLLPSILFQ